MNNPLYVSYHDEEWEQPLHDDQSLFCPLCRLQVWLMTMGMIVNGKEIK